MAGGAPSGTVTFLCTDVDDSAAARDDSAADRADAQRARDAILRDAITGHHGHVFSARGEGFAAVFATPADAVAAAIAAQEALRDDDLVTAPVRMAVHTGEGTPRGGDYVGPDVTRAGRLLALAHGGQILVSDTSEMFLRSRVTLRPLGEHRLRGARDRMAVHQVVVDGLPADFPVLRNTAAFAGNLPTQLGSLVGREDDVSAVADLVRSRALVTLHGIGGVGKTRLALEVAGEVAGEFTDGVWVVDLTSVADDASVPDAVAALLGVTPRADQTILASLADALADRQLLLVLDNCEHVMGGVTAVVDALLAKGGVVRVLATSRELLGHRGETTYAAAPLGVERGIDSDAVALFVERATSVRPDFGLRNAADAAAVTEICTTLDGLPLGIELAAARMGALSAVEVRDRLVDRFRLLRDADGRPERQHTLHHAVEWSYDLLDPAERALFDATAVFAGSFELAALCAVCDDTDDVEVLRHLDSLVRKSLVIADFGSTHTRYRLFETIRQFAEDRLVAGQRLEDTRDRHAAYFAAAATARWEQWNGPRWRTTVDWVEAELGNLRAAYRWSADRGDVGTATDLAAHAALMGFSVQLFETLEWAEQLIPAAAAADVSRLPRLYTAAGYACFAGRAEAARANAHRATELEVDPRYESCEPGYATFIEALGSVYCGDLDRYISLTGEVASRYGAGRGYGLAAYVDGLQSAGRVDEALGLAEQSVVAARELGNPYWIAYSLWIAGMAFSRRDTRRAFAAWDEGTAFVRQHHVQFFEGFLARDAARLHTSDGEPDAALALFADAIGAFHHAGNVPQLVITLASVPALFARLDRPAPALTLLGALAKEESSAHHVPEIDELTTRLTRELGDARSAELLAAGAALGLGEAAVYARQQLDVARREPRAGRPARPTRPGGLTRRELEVLRLVADGLTSQEIATQLFISPRTAEHHVQNIYTKLGVSSRAQATRWAVEHEVLT